MIIHLIAVAAIWVACSIITAVMLMVDLVEATRSYSIRYGVSLRVAVRAVLEQASARRIFLMVLVGPVIVFAIAGHFAHEWLERHL